jgi:hypothetical protein
MSKSIGTCGHELPYEWEHSGAAQVAVKAHDREGNRAVAYRMVCRDCRGRYADAGELLVTEPQCQRWLRGDPHCGGQHEVKGGDHEY